MNESFNMFAKCKTWTDVREELDRSCAVLALVKDDDALWIAKEYHNGIKDAAIAGVTALMFRQANGVGATIEEGMKLYQKAIALKEKATGTYRKDIRNRINSMQEMVAWSSQCRGLMNGTKRPVRIPSWRTPEKYSGLGNIFLWIGARGMGEAGSITDYLAMSGITTFLKEQGELSKRMEKKNGGRHEARRNR